MSGQKYTCPNLIMTLTKVPEYIFKKSFEKILKKNMYSDLPDSKDTYIKNFQFTIFHLSAKD